MPFDWHAWYEMPSQAHTLFQRKSVDLKLQGLVISNSFSSILYRTKSNSLHKSLTKTSAHYQAAFCAWEQWDSTARKSARHCSICFSSGAMLRGTLGIYLFLLAWYCHLRQCESSPHKSSANSKDWLQPLHSSFSSRHPLPSSPWAPFVPCLCKTVTLSQGLA